jgi:acyl carrier protein
MACSAEEILMAENVAAAVAEAFCAELSLPACGPDQTFFSLGGDSLQASQMVGRLNRRYGVRIPFGEIYRDGSSAAIGALIERMRAVPSAPRRSIASLARRRRNDWFPLALSQEGLYAIDSATQGAGLFNNVGLLRFSGDIDPDALLEAVRETVSRQSALRLIFGEINGRPAQRLTDEQVEVRTCDLRGVSAAGLARGIRRERLTGFDLHAAPAARFTLARVGQKAWTLMSTFHHIVFDGVSQGVFLDDLTQAYAYAIGAGPPLRPLVWDYADFAEWQRDTLRGDRLEAHLDAIAASLRREPVRRLTEPGSGPKSLLARALPYAVGSEQVNGLRRLAMSCDTTVFVALVAILLEFAARRTGDSSAAVAIQAANRVVEETEGVVGCFANSVLVAGKQPSSADPAEHVGAAREAVGEAISHQEMPLEPALRILAERGADGDRTLHLPQVGLAFQPDRTEHHDVPGGSLDASFVTQEGDAIDPASFAMVLELFSEDGALAGLTHHRVTEWPGDSFAEAEAELTAVFSKFSSAGSALARQTDNPRLTERRDRCPHRSPESSAMST